MYLVPGGHWQYHHIITIARESDPIPDGDMEYLLSSWMRLQNMRYEYS